MYNWNNQKNEQIDEYTNERIRELVKDGYALPSYVYENTQGECSDILILPSVYTVMLNDFEYDVCPFCGGKERKVGCVIDTYEGERGQLINCEICGCCIGCRKIEE